MRALLVFLMLSASAFAGETGKVVFVKGGAVQHIGSGVARALREGDAIEEGSTVQAPAGSHVKILFVKGSEVSLGADSQVNVVSLPSAGPSVFKLLRGYIRVKTPKQAVQAPSGAEKFSIKIEAPRLALGVKGTEFLVAARGAEQTSVYGFEGVVSVATDITALSRGEEHPVQPGEVISGGPAGIGKTGHFNRDELDQWLARYQPELVGRSEPAEPDASSAFRFRVGAAAVSNSVGNSFSAAFSWNPQLRLGSGFSLLGTLGFVPLKGAAATGTFYSVTAGLGAGLRLGQVLGLEAGAGLASWTGQASTAYVSAGPELMLGRRWAGLIDRLWASYSLLFFAEKTQDVRAGVGIAF